MISSISAISACFIMFPHVSSYFIIFHPFIFMDFPLRSSTNTTCGWSPNLKSFLRSSVWCFSAQLLEDLGDDLLGFSIRFCQTCSPPTSEKFLALSLVILEISEICVQDLLVWASWEKPCPPKGIHQISPLWGMWLLQSWHLQAWSLAIFRPIIRGGWFFVSSQKMPRKKNENAFGKSKRP